LKFTKEKVKVTNIQMEPSNNALNIIVHGWYLDEETKKSVGVTLYVDFSSYH
jgi:hypothetical protein